MKDITISDQYISNLFASKKKYIEQRKQALEEDARKEAIAFMGGNGDFIDYNTYIRNVNFAAEIALANNINSKDIFGNIELMTYFCRIKESYKDDLFYETDRNGNFTGLSLFWLQTWAEYILLFDSVVKEKLKCLELSL